MFDLLIQNASLPDGRQQMSVAVKNGKIVEVSPGLNAPAQQNLDAKGQLLSPPFVDAHFHMDATLSYGLPRVNQSGTLLEGIALWGELKPLLTQEALIERALAYCDWAVAKGLLAIRTHVDVCDDRLLAVDALLEVKRQVAPYIDLQLVAFPQDGVLRSLTALANLKRALDKGVDVVGGIPHFERTMSEGAASVRLLCELAAEQGKLVDMHCDESDDPLSRHIETLAFETQRLGLHGRELGIAHFIQHQQHRLTVAPNRVHPTTAWCDQLGAQLPQGHKAYRVPRVQGFPGQTTGQMGFPDAGWPHQDHIGRGFDKV